MNQDILNLYKKAQKGGLNAQEVFWLEGQAASHPCFGMAYMILARHHYRNQSTIKNKALLKAAAYSNNRTLLRHYLEDTLATPKSRPIPVSEMKPILEKKDSSQEKSPLNLEKKESTPPTPEPAPIVETADSPAAEIPVVEASLGVTPEEKVLVVETVEAKMDEVPVVEPLKEDVLVVETSVAETPKDDVPVVEAPVAENAKDDVPVVEVPVAETPTDAAPVMEVPAAETPEDDVSLVEAPVAETPKDEIPIVEAPSIEATEVPKSEAPEAEHIAAESPSPTFAPPAVNWFLHMRVKLRADKYKTLGNRIRTSVAKHAPALAAVIEIPSAVAEAPAVEAPMEQPIVDASIVDAPIVKAVVADAPVEPVVAEAPAVEAPIVEAVVTEAPIVEEPIVEAPVETAIVDAHVIESVVPATPGIEAEVVESAIPEAEAEALIPEADGEITIPETKAEETNTNTPAEEKQSVVPAEETKTEGLAEEPAVFESEPSVIGKSPVEAPKEKVTVPDKEYEIGSFSSFTFLSEGDNEDAEDVIDTGIATLEAVEFQTSDTKDGSGEIIFEENDRIIEISVSPEALNKYFKGRLPSEQPMTFGEFKIELDELEYRTPEENFAATSVNPPKQRGDGTAEKAEAPEEEVEARKQKVKAPVENVEAPKQKVETPTEEQPRKKVDDILEKFIENEPGITRGNLANSPTGDLAKDSSLLNEDWVTETLARIYAKQGNKAKAIKIYGKLRLRFPEKSDYFGSLIENLKQ